MEAGAQFRLATITYALAMTLMLGWLLYIGRGVIMPVLLAVIAVYILTTSAEALGRLPVFRRLGRRWRRLMVLIGILAVVLMLSAFVTSNAAAISAAIPGYEHNLDILQKRLMNVLGLDDEPNLRKLGNEILDLFDATALMPQIVSTLSNAGTLIIAAGLYAVFILADLDRLPGKTRLALGESERTEQTLEIVRQINVRIGSYLAAKTLVNALLAAVSLAILWATGIEFALFWAILIGLLNYIPYIGSIFGVVFPVTMSLVQFGSLSHAALVLVLLLVVQSSVAYFLEPKILGRSVNLSPLMVLLALAVWTSLWGLTGAILAVPLTAMVTIILAEFPGTRFIAIFMSEHGQL